MRYFLPKKLHKESDSNESDVGSVDNGLVHYEASDIAKDGATNNENNQHQEEDNHNASDEELIDKANNDKEEKEVNVENLSNGSAKINIQSQVVERALGEEKNTEDNNSNETEPTLTESAESAQANMPVGYKFKCLPCSRVYRSNYEFVRHTKTQKHKLALESAGKEEIVHHKEEKLAPPPTVLPKYPMEELKCVPCDQTYRNTKDLLHHLESKQHKMILGFIQEEGEEEEEAPDLPVNEDIPKDLRCTACDYTFGGVYAYRRHLTKQRHLKLTGSLNEPQNVGDDDKEVKCEICEHVYSNREKYQQHKKSKKHRKNLKASKTSSKNKNMAKVETASDDDDENDDSHEENPTETDENQTETEESQQGSSSSAIFQECAICKSTFTSKRQFWLHLETDAHKKQFKLFNSTASTSKKSRNSVAADKRRLSRLLASASNWNSSKIDDENEKNPPVTPHKSKSLVSDTDEMNESGNANSTTFTTSRNNDDESSRSLVRRKAETDPHIPAKLPKLIAEEKVPNKNQTNKKKTVEAEEIELIEISDSESDTELPPMMIDQARKFKEGGGDSEPETEVITADQLEEFNNTNTAKNCDRSNSNSEVATERIIVDQSCASFKTRNAVETKNNHCSENEKEPIIKTNLQHNKVMKTNTSAKIKKKSSEKLDWFKCQYCPRVFSVKSQAIFHIRNFHIQQTEESSEEEEEEEEEDREDPSSSKDAIVAEEDDSSSNEDSNSDSSDEDYDPSDY